MPYKRKTLPSTDYRNIVRRRKRKFQDHVYNHQRFISLLTVQEIGDHYPELVKVLWDFYSAGIFDGATSEFEMILNGINDLARTKRLETSDGLLSTKYS